MDRIKKLKIRAVALALAATSTLTLAGCDGKELAPKEEYDIVEQGDNSLSNAGLQQIIEVPGQDFKLVTEYSCDSASKREWRITSDKFLYIRAYTKGLPEETEVYIDNVHVDTSIKSKYAIVDGILQDSMDDHVHSSQLIGFPVSNDISYYGVNAIEGCNQEFIEGTAYGYNGYYNASIESVRRTEKEYLEMGVYANKIQIVYDLLVKGPNDKDFQNISVCTDFIVPVSGAEIDYEQENEKSK